MGRFTGCSALMTCRDNRDNIHQVTNKPNRRSHPESYFSDGLVSVVKYFSSLDRIVFLGSICWQSFFLKLDFRIKKLESRRREWPRGAFPF